MKIGVAGLGLIGGSLALALRDRHEVTGYDTDERRAMAGHEVIEVDRAQRRQRGTSARRIV